MRLLPKTLQLWNERRTSSHNVRELIQREESSRNPFFV
jgi:hypothetical protein